MVASSSMRTPRPSACLRRLFTWLTAAASANLVWWVAGVDLAWPWRVLIGVAIVLGYILISIRPRKSDPAPVSRRVNAMRNGYELLLAVGVATLANSVWWVWLGLRMGQVGATGLEWAVHIATVLVGGLLILGLAANGFVRVAIGSSQLPISTKVLVALLWWFPPATVLLLGKTMRTVNQESRTAVQRQARDEARHTAQICHTRYPILMVHGIFFRDWDLLNYWGRIRAGLIANGATLHYGGQQSSASVATSGSELADTIRLIVQQTNCGKLNIIAHSKGGLDARWAISQCGVSELVASLTTINTPHWGRNFVGQLLDRIPHNTVGKIADGYDTVFERLGDSTPDFLAGVADLTDTECARLNALMTDAPGVYYQSVGSQMTSRYAAPFPLNLGYSLIQPYDGDNDGLVAVTSMTWGTCLGVVTPTGKQGVSHADMIDLLRRDIGDFDVCEFYVQLVSGLRERGL
jgi:triacylglycerol lipase